MKSMPAYWRELPQFFRLEAARCKVCGKICYPPRRICPACRAREFETIVLPNEGTLVTFTVIRVAPSSFSSQSPYAVAIVELGKGVRIMAQVAGCDPQELKTGQRVRLEFRRISADGEAGIICYGHKAVPA